MFAALTPFLSLLFVLLAAGLLTCAAAVALMAGSLLRPPRMTDGKALYLLQRVSPADLSLRYEEVAFKVRDERTGQPLRLAGWWIPAKGKEPGDRCAVLVHGYADGKVGAIAWAPAWHALGFHVLAIDLRAHGESGGRESTGGWFERHDLLQVLDQLRAERPAETRRLALFGVSLGAAVATAAAAMRNDRGGPAADVAAVVLESPFADFRHAAAANMARLGLPGGWVRRAALALAERFAGADFAAVRTVDRLRDVPCPVMVITSGADDACLAPGDAAAIEAAVRARPAERGPGVYWEVKDVGHLMAFVSDPETYQAKLREFLDVAWSTSHAEPANGAIGQAVPERS